MYTFTTNNKCQHWDMILAALSVLNAYVVHGLNGLDTYILCTVYEQDENKLHACYCLHAIQHAE